jgi:hypothetical protein
MRRRDMQPITFEIDVTEDFRKQIDEPDTKVHALCRYLGGDEWEIYPQISVPIYDDEMDISWLENCTSGNVAAFYAAARHRAWEYWMHEYSKQFRDQFEYDRGC